MLTIHVWPKWLKRFLLTHPLYKSPPKTTLCFREHENFPHKILISELLAQNGAFLLTFRLSI